jgi:hypothetical protein
MSKLERVYRDNDIGGLIRVLSKDMQLTRREEEIIDCMSLMADKYRDFFIDIDASVYRAQRVLKGLKDE